MKFFSFLSHKSVYVNFLFIKFFRKPKSFAFFHPYCDAGGGGERVLWKAVTALQKKFLLVKYKQLIFLIFSFKEKLRLIIYTGDFNVSPSEIILNAEHRFNICVDLNSIEFIYLRLIFNILFIELF